MSTVETASVQVFSRAERLMGNRFHISVVAEELAEAEPHIDAAIAEIQRIEKLLTTFSEDSETAKINRMAGISPVKVDEEVFQLMARANRISALTQGAFDLSYGSVDKGLWNFDLNMKALPDPEIARKSVRLINWQNIQLNPDDCSVFLREKGMRIGFGGIGKGYAADRAKDLLKQRGVHSGVINASGDLCVWGERPDGSPWSIGISDPDHPAKILGQLKLQDQAVATSGDYEKYVIIGGKRYSHTIDPKTGLPVTGLKSVTVIAPQAELADAMTTPIMVMGLHAGLNLINQLKGFEAILITDDNRLHLSHNFSGY